MPDGRTINNLYYGSGHLHQINIDGHLISDIERDNLHREIQRTQGKLNTTYTYDSTHRLLQKTSQRHPYQSAITDILIERKYQYNNLDHLISTYHSKHGRTDYRYDVTGRIEGCRNQRYWDTLQYDAAANLLDHRRPIELHQHNQNVIRCNQLLNYKSHHYRYDEHGRTASKQSSDGTQHYHYDAEHRLSAVHIEQSGYSQRYGYVYDALGRRIEKHQIDHEGNPYNRTRFLWDGFRLLQETSPIRHQSVYIYTDQYSYEALARIDKRGSEEQEIRYFHTNLNGCPEELTDAEGKILWECSFQLWGKRIHKIEYESVE